MTQQYNNLAPYRNTDLIRRGRPASPSARKRSLHKLEDHTVDDVRVRVTDEPGGRRYGMDLDGAFGVDEGPAGVAKVQREGRAESARSAPHGKHCLTQGGAESSRRRTFATSHTP